MVLFDVLKSFSLISMVLLCGPAFNNQGIDPVKLRIFVINEDYQKDFCKSGTFSKSIRSKSGKDCENQLGAALALVICRDVGDFNGSQCDIKAQNTIGKAEQAGSLQLKVFAPTEACVFMGNILGETFLKSCQTRLAGLAYLPPTPNQPISKPPSISPSKPSALVQPPVVVRLPDLVVWETADINNLLQAKKLSPQVSQEVKARTGLGVEAKFELLNNSLNRMLGLSDIGSTITTVKLADVSPKHLGTNDNKLGIVFTKSFPDTWKDPVPGEIKYLNGIRFQFIATDSSDNYSLLVASRNFNPIPSSFFAIKVPTTFKISDLLGRGGNAEVRKLNYKSRELAIKQYPTDGGHAFGEPLQKEVMNYEAVLEKMPTANLIYRGFLGAPIHQPTNIKILLALGTNMKDYLKSATKNDVANNFSTILSFMADFHNKGFLHNDIKENNFLIVNGKAQIIDFDNMQRKGLIAKGGGFTQPYYRIGEEFGIKSDLKALGFTFFSMLYFKDERPEYQAKFKIAERTGEKYLDGNLNPEDIIKLLTPSTYKIDKVILNLISKNYETAHDALKDF